MLHYLRSSPTSTSVPAMHRSACSLLATFTTLVLPSPPQSFANMLLLKKWTWVCFLKSLPSLTQNKHLAISMYGPFTVSSAGRCGTVTPLIFTVNILCLLAFLILTSWWWETFLWPALPFRICQLPFHLFRFLPALHGCTRRFCIRPFINPTYFLFFFCRFSLLSHFNNLRDHWNHIERSILVAFQHAWRSKSWKRVHSPYFREVVLVWGFLACKFFYDVFKKRCFTGYFYQLQRLMS